MTVSEITALFPMIIVSAAALIVVLQVAAHRNHFASFVLTVIGFIAGLISLDAIGPGIPTDVSVLLRIDSFGRLFMGLILSVSLVTSFLAYVYLRRFDENKGEYYVVLLLATLGAMVLVTANHFVSFFLGLEVLTVSLYVMIAYRRKSELCLEAAVKYLILAAASSAFLLFGMALIYADVGSMTFKNLASAIFEVGDMYHILPVAGIGLIIVGVGFKLAVVPFHMWTPDVYQGAPAPSTAFIATVSKSGVVAVILRLFMEADAYRMDEPVLIFSIIAVASMIAGNVLALLQKDVKRVLAYSSIAHLGYVLVAFLAGGSQAIEGVYYYLVVYSVTTLGAFGIVTVMSDSSGEKSDIEDFRGLFWRRPWLAGVFTSMLLSLAGIPLTAGFIGKFFVLKAGVDATNWTLVIVLVLSSTIGLFYYLRIVAAMLSTAPDSSEIEITRRQVPVLGGVILGVLTIALFYFGIYPGPLLEIIRSATISGF